ncbi:DMT family transporter [Halocalculus aciditolerans]|uniref:EamA family transporter n=1 Tax=Halocalculus aciditolerans TaxID=1383812 RepID=A0A830F3K8_9EURY|nr:EamA family transporter [Halocalculus aciditolerans]GGL51705.1 EamA family transporter [Halocalculus aciditolerans]
MTRYRNLALFCVLAAVWGSAFMAIKAGLEFVPPVFFAAVRYDVAGVIMLAWAWHVTDHWLPENREEWVVVAIGAVFLIAGYHALLFVGEDLPGVTSAAASVVVSLSPVLTTAFSRVLLPKEGLSAVGVLGLLLGLVGVAVLVLPPSFFASGNVGVLGSNAVGELLIFGAAACFAFGSVLTERVDADLPIETMEAWSMLGGALLMHAVSLGRGEPQTFTVNATSLAAIAYLSLAASALGFLIYFDLHERLGSIEINLVSYVAPVFAALSGFIFLRETLDPTTVVGFLVIFTGFALLKRDALTDELARVRRADS